MIEFQKHSRLLLSLALAVVAAAPVGAQRRTEPEAFTWSGRVPEGRWIMIRNVNGTIEVAPGTTDRVEVVATRHTRRGDPEFVRFEVK
jgi:hypothetical protein